MVVTTRATCKQVSCYKTEKCNKICNIFGFSSNKKNVTHANKEVYCLH